MVGEITLLMIQQHAKLHKLLTDYETEAKISKKKGLFSDFKTNLEKHFLIEELNLFNLAQPKNKKQEQEVQNLFRDHEDLRNTSSEMVAELLSNTVPNPSVFKKILLNHEKNEIDIFYPRLDNELSKEDKATILTRIKASKF